MPSYYNPYSYQPNYFNPYNQPQPTAQNMPVNAPSMPQNNGNGVNWVQGESGAKSWAVAPNNTVLLMDSEAERFYLKSTDASGMPLPLRIFDYKERTNEQSKKLMQNNVEYVTKAEFDAFKDELLFGKPEKRKDKKEVKQDE